MSAISRFSTRRSRAVPQFIQLQTNTEKVKVQAQRIRPVSGQCNGNNAIQVISLKSLGDDAQRKAEMSRTSASSRRRTEKIKVQTQRIRPEPAQNQYVNANLNPFAAQRNGNNRIQVIGLKTIGDKVLLRSANRGSVRAATNEELAQFFKTRNAAIDCLRSQFAELSNTAVITKKKQAALTAQQKSQVEIDGHGRVAIDGHGRVAIDGHG